MEHSSGIVNWIKLIRADGVGPTTFMRLVKHFKTVENVLGSSVHQFTKIEGVGTKTAEKIRRSIDAFNVDRELELAEKLGVCILNWKDSRYPPALKKIYDPPPVLYVKGTLEPSDGLSVAIVGSRRCSLYGTEQASRFAHMLASSGFTIVSGMARGIDTAAHSGALSAEGRTLAVQGCGLANIFPPENKKLAGLISDSGAIISELPLTYEPLSENFPSRNRIIAGLTLGTLVVEATARSGALITARCAMESNREVMAIPGKIDSPLSAGPNRLIKDGARLIDSVEEIVETLGYIGNQLKEHVSDSAKKAQKKAEMPLFQSTQLKFSDNETRIVEFLDNQAQHIDEIITGTGLTAGKVNSTLMSLRLKGFIKQLPGNFFKTY